MKCHCSSGKPFSDCCEPFLSKDTLPDSAEKLMRSRYSAYVTENIDYLIHTTHSTTASDYKKSDLAHWAKSSQWQKLEIISTQDGLKTDATGFVEFKAYYQSKGVNTIHHEKSLFMKESDKWFYVNGNSPEQAKIKRNTPCPCGSGKKYKKCCGA